MRDVPDGVSPDALRLRAEFAGLADRARHPALALASFLDDPVDTDGSVDIDEMDEADLLASGATVEQLYAASLRRAAVIWAANEVISSCADDLTVLDWDLETGLPDPDSGLEEPFLWRYFPPRFRGAYTRAFQMNVLITATKVAYDLARPDAGAPACIAEELVMNAVIRLASAGMDQAGLGQPWLDPSEVLLEDLDFDVLFSPNMDGIESDPATQRDFGMWVPGAADWFTPFNSERIVHPFCQTEQTGPHVHDLHRLLDEDSHDQVFDPTIVDRNDPITGLTCLSDIVRVARRNQDPSVDDVWVPDADHPQESYSQLLALIETGGVSGWLTWQPDEGASSVRTQSVVQFRPHRHFPVGADQPWAEVSASSVILFVPLSAVVAFQPDPGVRAPLGQPWPRQLGPN
jgi:hypothetical protein